MTEVKPVLFAATRPYDRAENMRKLYDDFDGKKVFVEVDGWRRHPEIGSGKYDLMVIDEFPTETPGKCIMIWHAIQGGKLIGLDQPHPYHREECSQLMDYIVTSGTGAVPLFAKCAMLPEERVLPYGLPRTDRYGEMRKGDGGTVMARKRGYLYAPTYRNKEETPYPEICWDWLDEQLMDDEIMVVKAHTASVKLLDRQYRHILEVSSREMSAPYLTDCDVVITDYSSIIFDGYLLGKPSVLFEKRPGYLETRGMYLDYPKAYSSLYAQDEKRLLSMMRNATGLGQVEKDVVASLADGCDGHATERIIRLIHEMNG